MAVESLPKHFPIPPAGASPTSAAQKVWVRGPKVLLMGMEGHGKTDSIRTIIEAGLKCFVVFVEPGMEVLVDTRRGRPVYTCAQGLHWKYIPVAMPTWQDLREMAKYLNTLSYEGVANVAPQHRERFQAHMELVSTMGDLKCDRCNERFGPADHLEPYDQWAVVNDSLTSISKAFLLGHIGTKPAVHRGEYGNAMYQIGNYIDMFCGMIPSMAVMMAHIDREPNEVSGGFENMVATLGQKLAPKIPRPFSDVVLAKRVGDQFTWSTIEESYRTKTRNLPFSRVILPTFAPMIREWHRMIEAEKAAQGANSQLQDAAKPPPVGK